jgi:hypothetical protein
VGCAIAALASRRHVAHGERPTQSPLNHSWGARQDDSDCETRKQPDWHSQCHEPFCGLHPRRHVVCLCILFAVHEHPTVSVGSRLQLLNLRRGESAGRPEKIVSGAKPPRWGTRSYSESLERSCRQGAIG